MRHFQNNKIDHWRRFSNGHWMEATSLNVILEENAAQVLALGLARLAASTNAWRPEWISRVNISTSIIDGKFVKFSSQPVIIFYHFLLQSLLKTEVFKNSFSTGIYLENSCPFICVLLSSGNISFTILTRLLIWKINLHISEPTHALISPNC